MAEKKQNGGLLKMFSEPVASEDVQSTFGRQMARTQRKLGQIGSQFSILH
jgi:hypothetical protein